MNRLSLLMWLAIILAVVPLLAVPVWLMKAAVIVIALVMAGTTYSLIHQSDSGAVQTDAKATSRHIAPGFHSQTVNAKADADTQAKDRNQQTTEEGFQDTNVQQPQQESNPQSTQESGELTEDELKRQFFNTKNTPKAGQKNTEDSQTEDAGPVNVTDPNSDRFIAVNTYKSRSNRLRS